MNFIRQKMVSLRNRARDLQTSLRRWALYDDALPREAREELFARFTPEEETSFESDLELTKMRLRPASTQIRTLTTWFNFVLDVINEQLDRARQCLDQTRIAECQAIVTDVETRMVVPNEQTLGFVFRSLAQHTSCESHQKMASIDAIIRDLYLPTMKLAHQRNILPKEALSRTPIALLTDAPDAFYSWRQHVSTAQAFGRRIPVSLLAIPRNFVAQPWNLTAIAHEVGRYVYSHLELRWEMISKLQTETISNGVSPATANLWASWHDTLFADVFGVLKLGPAYVSGMIEMLGTAPTNTAGFTNPTTSGVANTPPAYIRWHVMLQTLEMLNFSEQARALYHEVYLLAGDPNQVAQRSGAIWAQLVAETRTITGTIAFSPCQKLAGARLVDIAQPFLATEIQTAMKVRDLLLSGDDATSDENFSWATSLSTMTVTAPIALAGLRLAYESADFDASRRMWVRFWCLMQLLTGNGEPAREREDREFAPGDAALKQIAQHAIPAMAIPTMTIPAMAMSPGAMPAMPMHPMGVPMHAMHHANMQHGVTIMA